VAAVYRLLRKNEHFAAAHADGSHLILGQQFVLIIRPGTMLQPQRRHQYFSCQKSGSNQKTSPRVEMERLLITCRPWRYGIPSLHRNRLRLNKSLPLSHGTVEVFQKTLVASRKGHAVATLSAHDEENQEAQASVQCASWWSVCFLLKRASLPLGEMRCLRRCSPRVETRHVVEAPSDASAPFIVGLEPSLQPLLEALQLIQMPISARYNGIE
jgi:hypothetical protein